MKVKKTNKKVKKEKKGSSKKPISKKTTSKKVTSKKTTSKKVTSKKVTQSKKKQIKYIKGIKRKIPVIIENETIVKKGYFNKQTTKYLLKGLLKIYPNLSKAEISRRAEISEKTLNKLLEQSEKTKFQKKTFKKISKFVNNFDSEIQLQLAETTKHIKKYGNISDKKLKEIIEQVSNKMKFVSELEDKEYLFYKALYEKISEMDFNE